MTEASIAIICATALLLGLLAFGGFGLWVIYKIGTQS